jgi:hypothetical protein
MKLILPENISEITLLQYQKYIELQEREDLTPHDFNVRKIQIFTGLKSSEVKSISSIDYAEILNIIDKAINEEAFFQPTFKIENVEFGIIPNFDDMTMAEYIDLCKYETEGVKELHKLMSILFRPISKKDAFGNYEIESYKGTDKYSEIMKLMPLSCVNGCLVFFCNLKNELLNFILKSTNQEQAKDKKQATTLKSGDGTQQLMI